MTITVARRWAMLAAGTTAQASSAAMVSSPAFLIPEPAPPGARGRARDEPRRGRPGGRGRNGRADVHARAVGHRGRPAGRAVRAAGRAGDHRRRRRGRDADG
ncbi:hypothetical protein [Nocardioides convexus]|uniref:hypothetical protein n=1 Tax=Nocardioides convexus TaxID=2712224 RepID=UPI00241842E8|nr:hypothetical protein [Nocardioides convexus]